MKTFSTLPKRNIARWALACILYSATSAFAYDWDDIPAEDLQATECPSDPTAAAEVLYKNYVVDQGLDFEHIKSTFLHLRVKIYRESALERLRKVRIHYTTNRTLTDLHARVVKPDGRSIEIEKSDVFEQVDERKQEYNVISTSFAMSNAEVGDIIEYTYRQNFDSGFYQPRLFVYFQEEWPIRKIDMKIRPFTWGVSGTKWASQFCNEPLRKVKDGFYEISMENVTAYPEEPNQVPDQDGKAWFLFYSVENDKVDEDYWNDIATQLYRKTELQSKVTSAIKTKAQELLAGIENSEDQIVALHDFCRTEITNAVYGEKSAISPSNRKNLNSDKPAGKILKQGYGTPVNINSLFCALAKASGYDARLAYVSDRSQARFSKNVENRTMALPHQVVAIKNGGSWDFAAPGRKFLKYGSLDWRNQGAVALIADKKSAILVSTKLDDATGSTSISNGAFHLDSSGTLRGTVTYESVGQYNYLAQRSISQISVEGLEEHSKKKSKKAWPTSEISDFEVHGLHSTQENLRVQFTVTIPQYAEVIGKRVFFQPSAFRKNDESKYPLETRKTDLAYDYRYTNKDHVEITLPSGYTFEAPSAPHPVKVEHLGDYKARISINKTTNTLIYDRTFQFHSIRYPSRTYPLIKKFFDNIHKQDGHTLTIVAPLDSPSPN